MPGRHSDARLLGEPLSSSKRNQDLNAAGTSQNELYTVL